MICWCDMETKNWRQECERLQAELDTIRLEASDWKEKFERLMLWKEQPRLHVRGLTTMGYREGDDLK